MKSLYYDVMRSYERLLRHKNERTYSSNGVVTRYKNPVLTAEHIPPFWKYDLDETMNPFFMQRLSVNSVFNAGALKFDGKYVLVARIEGCDRKSFFGIAESTSPVDGFRFRDHPVIFPDTYPEETNVYDMRLTQHEDGWIYGVFCSEMRDFSSSDISAAKAVAGIVRTKNLTDWERLPNLKTNSPQQRNVVLHPEFVGGKYAFYTRPMDGFLSTSSDSGIGFGLCEDITHAEIKEEKIIEERRYHTVNELKNGAGAVPIKTEKGWIHIAHGVRNTAAGMRYVIYAFATDLNDPSKVIARPGGYLLAPIHNERIGDVSNVLFSNGAIRDYDGRIYIYYASSDTRLHVASTSTDKLIDYVFNTPEDALRSADCVKQRDEMITKNLRLIEEDMHK